MGYGGHGGCENPHDKGFILGKEGVRSPRPPRYASALFSLNESGKKSLVEKSLVEKMAVERKPGGKKALSVLEKMEKSLVYFFRFDTRLIMK